MANTEIDSLSLDIQIKGLKEKDVANLDKLSKAVARLTKSLKDADFSKLKEIQVPKGLKNMPIIMNQSVSAKIMGDTSNTFAKTQEELSSQMEETTKAVGEQVEEITKNNLEIAKADNGFTSFIGKIKQATSVLFGFRKANKDNNKQVSGFGKILKRFKTIAFIKAVRAILNAVVQAIQQGISNLAQFDKEFNKTISSIKTSVTNITNSLALTFRPLIEIIEPFVANLSNALVGVGNAVSKLQAQTKGLSTYTKINAKYTEDYAKSMQKANLFSFDTFNSIDTTGNDMYETASVDESTTEEADKIGSLLLELQNTLGYVFELLGYILETIGEIINSISPILTPLIKIINMALKPIVKLVGDVLDILKPIIDFVVNLIAPVLDLIVDILEPIFQIVSDILSLFEPIIEFLTEIIYDISDVNDNHLSAMVGFLHLIVDVIQFIADAVRMVIDRFKSSLDVTRDLYDFIKAIVTFDFDSVGEKWSKLWEDVGKHIRNTLLLPFKLVLRFIDMMINNMVNALNLILKPFSKIREMLGNSSLQIDFQSNLTGSFENWIDSFANGGIVGEIWQMNEYGNPEMLYNANNSGNTAVITQEQLARAFENAIYNTGLLDVIQNSGNLYLDGKQVAQSQSFKNEMNRTNPSLNIR